MEQHNNMNGLSDNNAELNILDKKPIVTYAGDKELFLSLEATLSSSLPQEAAEWQRSYGRAIKSVQVSATFVPFTKEVLPKEGNFHLIEQPMLHTYWTQCSDVDTYKASVRDEIELWMRVLVQYNLTDWMIVLVETYDFRKTNKLLPRTTVLDKIRSDFGAKHAARCLSVINPLRSESRSGGSWRGLIVNFRLLLLTAYDRTLLRFEEIIREQRERRNQPGWSFTKYFLLQEELAFVLEMLGVYEEALIQYDELDALFTQFVLNSHLGESPSWLVQFTTPLESWAGLTLKPKINVKERARIQENTMSLLQFRNYLFSRQCAMLLYAKKPWEVAERTLPFLHNCIREMSLLEVGCTSGAVSCWVFLSCIEVLLTCQTYTDINHVKLYSIYTAGLWAYAKQKLAELGELCGLMPGMNQTSEQIHTVVEISSGLDDSSAAPVDKLKKALASQQAFCKQFLELSELAMSTYKHIGRVRCARGIGHELAKFYRALGDHSTATSFLQNALHSYEQDGWKQIAAATRLELAQSYLQLGDLSKYVKMCSSIASSSELSMDVRMKHYEEMVNILKNSTADPPWTGYLSDCITLTDIDIQVDKGSTSVTAVVSLSSALPVPTHCSKMAVSVVPVKQNDSKPNSKHKEPHSNLTKRRSKEDLVPVNSLLQRLPVVLRLDYQEDKSLGAANVDIKNQKSLLRRQDSHGKYRKISTVTKSDFNRFLSATDIVLEPGPNTITLVSKDNEPGCYRLSQFSVLLLGKLELLSTTYKLNYEVTQCPPSITLNTVQGDLLAGVPQVLSLDINTGGCHILNESILRLRTSNGLTVKLKDGEDPPGRTLDVPLPGTPPNETIQVPLLILAHLAAQRDPSSMEHSVTIKAPWSEEEQHITLSLQPVFMTTFRIHTAKHQKFVHVTVSGLSQQKVSLYSPLLEVTSPPSGKVTTANPPDTPMVVNSENKVGLMWMLETDNSSDSGPIKTELSLSYHAFSDEPHQTPLLYKCTYDIHHYKTMYLVESKVEPLRGSEFCRVSTVCKLVLKVTRVNKTSDTSLMYEVVAEHAHNMWAICGRHAGVLTLDTVDVQSVSLDVMPLINGYLPLPKVRLSKYIPANAKNMNNSRVDSHSRLEPFRAGEVYNVSKGSQVHVIAAASPQDAT